MNEQLFKHLDVRPWNTNLLNGKAVNPALECQAYEQKVTPDLLLGDTSVTQLISLRLGCLMRRISPCLASYCT